VSLDDCRNSKLAPASISSSKGFPILVRDIGTQSRQGSPVRVLLLGGIHGDELTSSAIVFKWLQAMQSPAAQQILWRVVPVLNPDGLLAAKPMRMNAHGIDLNRNFPTPNWKEDAPAYWRKVTRSDPRRYPGAAPLSEPESRWVVDAMEKFKPDVIISVHAPYGVLDFDGPAKPPSRFGRLTLNPVGVYPGSLGNYSGLQRSIPVVTIELPHASALPPPAEVERIWQDMLAWIKGHVQPGGLAATRQAKL
jgi:hypothetical protein